VRLYEKDDFSIYLIVVCSFDESNGLNLKIIASRKGDFLTQQNPVADAIAFIQRVNCCFVPFAANIDASSIVKAVSAIAL
jgi:hypothetical protein